jgi:hypothetical protein
MLLLSFTPAPSTTACGSMIFSMCLATNFMIASFFHPIGLQNRKRDDSRKDAKHAKFGE